MRHVPLLAFLAALYAAPSLAQALVPCAASCPARYFYERQPLTRAAPTGVPMAGTVGSGMIMSSVKGVRISACAPAGQTFTGTGSLRAYLYVSTGVDPDWHRSDTGMDLAFLAAWNGRRCVVWPDFLPGALLPHWVLYASDTVGMAGTATVPALQNTVLVRLEGTL